MSVCVSALAESAALSQSPALMARVDRLLGRFPGLSEESNRSALSTLLVSTEERDGEVWASLLGYPAPAGAPGLPFLAEATQAFANAADLASALQLRWVSDLARRKPESAMLLEHDAPHAPPVRLDGASFGGAFFIYEFARLAGLQVPGSVVALACVEQGGQLAPVSHFREKLEALLRRAPAVRTIYTALYQLEGLPGDDSGAIQELTLSHGVVIAPRATVAELADDIFGEKVASALGASERDSLVSRLFFSSLGPVSHQVVWSAKMSLAGRLGQAPLAPLTATKLAFVRAVASRRERGADGGSLDELGALMGALPRELALQVAAHGVQDATTYANDGDDAVAFCAAAATLVGVSRPLSEMSPTELKVLGALARRTLIYGDATEAFERNEALARAWFEIRPEEASYPLSQLYRCIAVAPEMASASGWYDRAEEVVRGWRACGGWHRSGADFIELEAARANLFAERRVQVQGLVEIARDPNRSPTVRIAAAFYRSVALLMDRASASADLERLRGSSLSRVTDLQELSAARDLWLSACRARGGLVLLPENSGVSSRLRNWLSAFPEQSLRWQLATAPWGW